MKDKEWVSVALPLKMKIALDAYCDDNGFTRSEFLRMIIRKAVME
jgi:metal-responsive CopG/Arc/MetJ family transcriptional regulator